MMTNANANGGGGGDDGGMLSLDLTLVEADHAAMATAPLPTITLEKLRAMREVIAPGLNDGELAFFAEVCNALGLSPLLRQIHATKRQDKPVFQTGIDGYRLLASRTHQLVGIDDPVYDMEGADHPTWARTTVYRWQQNQRIPYTATARWPEYVQRTRDGRVTQMWAKMPYLMLGKCSEALALRRAFPAELSGIYTDEEMMQADNPALATYTEHAPEHANAAPAPQPVSQQAALPAPVNARETTSQKALRVLGEAEWYQVRMQVAGTVNANKMTPAMKSSLRGYVDAFEAAQEAGDFPPERPVSMVAPHEQAPADDDTDADEWQDATEADTAADATPAVDDAPDLSDATETAPVADHAATRPPTDAQVREIARLSTWLKLPETLPANSEAHARAIILDLSQQWAAHVTADSRAKKRAEARRAEAAAERAAAAASLEHLPPLGGHH